MPAATKPTNKIVRIVVSPSLLSVFDQNRSFFCSITVGACPHLLFADAVLHQKLFVDGRHR